MRATRSALGEGARLALCWLGLCVGACEPRVAAEPERAPTSVAQQMQPAPANDSRLRQLADELGQHPQGSPERAAFVAKQIEDARFSSTAAARTWASGDAALAQNAYAFLQNSADLALRPVIEQPLPSAPAAVTQGLWLIGDAETELRRKVLAHVDALLGDKRALPAEPGQAGAPHRVCDEAYATLRRMVSFSESELKAPFIARVFFASAPAARDALIERARRTPSWQRILDPAAHVDDKPEKPSAPAPARARPRPTLMQ
ncbi:MAG TPA: hypothetical protein VGI10_14570 [Polyangiaceae bacterium]|jgi:hypothetical protein